MPPCRASSRKASGQAGAEPMGSPILGPGSVIAVSGETRLRFVSAGLEGRTPYVRLAHRSLRLGGHRLVAIRSPVVGLGRVVFTTRASGPVCRIERGVRPGRHPLRSTAHAPRSGAARQVRARPDRPQPLPMAAIGRAPTNSFSVTKISWQIEFMPTCIARKATTVMPPFGIPGPGSGPVKEAVPRSVQPKSCDS